MTWWFWINLKILGKISAIIVAGGYGQSSVDILLEDLGIKQLPNLPQNIYGSSMAAHNAHWSILSQKRHKVLKIDPFEIIFLLFSLNLYKKVQGKPHLFWWLCESFNDFWVFEVANWNLRKCRPILKDCGWTQIWNTFIPLTWPNFFLAESTSNELSFGVLY